MNTHVKLSERRERAINRAITRAVYEPAPSALALIEYLKTLDPSDFSTEHVDIAHVGSRFWVDGVDTTEWASAVSLLQDRYGLDRVEAEQLLSARSRYSGGSADSVSRVRGIR